MNSPFVKKILHALAVIALFFVLILVYFSPVLDKKELKSHDVMQYKGMAREITEFEEKTGEKSLWTNSMFGGMPTYLIHVTYQNLTQYVHKAFCTSHTTPHMIAFMYFVCFFLAMLVLDIPILLSMLGALLYGFSSYFFIIIEAGHITKAIALGYMPLIIAGAVAAYKNKVLIGSVVFSLFLALQILINHLQITYYTMLILLVYIIFQIYTSIKDKPNFVQSFVKPSVALLVGVLLAVGSNFGSLYMTYDYGKDTMRGKSELTHNADDKTSGLDISYATAWSYGIDETINLFVPNFKGGSSMGALSENSAVYKVLTQNNVPQARQHIQSMPVYWGDQSFTSGPVYVGAVAIFLFVFALLYVQGMYKWWLLSVTLLSIFLAWGHNFMPLTKLFLYYFPGYNKFRTVSMILIIAQFAIPFLGVLSLQKLFTDTDIKAFALKKLKLALYITGGFLLVLLLISGSIYDFAHPSDAQRLPEWLLSALQADRKSLLYADIWRSLFFVAVAGGVILLWMLGKVKQHVAIILIALFATIDLWTVDKRYLNNDDFTSKRSQNQTFAKSEADISILQDTDPNYRVMNLTVSPFNDASTSYFHKSIGGYHGAKLKRYQELIDFHLSTMNMQVYNMLNTKYFIVQDKQTGKLIPQYNSEAMGNAWFVESVQIVENADAEIAALESTDIRRAAIVDTRFASQLSDTTFTKDSAAYIRLSSYAPNALEYTYSSAYNAAAVFSEIFYDKGWNAYIDGTPAPHFRANYVLRAMELPAGEHTISFKFEPRMYAVSNTISLISSLIALAVFVFVFVFECIKRKESLVLEA